MNKFLISSDDCLILKAIKDSLSLRQAAQTLGRDPAGIARRIRFIADSYGVLTKNNNRWHLNGLGLELVSWVEASIQSQEKILTSRSSLRIASASWLAEEVLIPNVKQIKRRSPEIPRIDFFVPEKGFELSLIDGTVDFAVQCNPPERPEIAHRQVAGETWIVVVPDDWKREFSSRRSCSFSNLMKRPFVRHSKINFDLILQNLDVEHVETALVADNLVAVRSAIRSGLGWSIVPQMLVTKDLREGLCYRFPAQPIIPDRKICLWWKRGRKDIQKNLNHILGWVIDSCAKVC